MRDVKQTQKTGDVNVTVKNAATNKVALTIGKLAGAIAVAGACATGGGVLGHGMAQAGQEGKLDKILAVVMETREKVIRVEADIKNIKENQHRIEKRVNKNENDIERVERRN